MVQILSEVTCLLFPVYYVSCAPLIIGVKLEKLSNILRQAIIYIR